MKILELPGHWMPAQAEAAKSRQAAAARSPQDPQAHWQAEVAAVAPRRDQGRHAQQPGRCPGLAERQQEPRQEPLQARLQPLQPRAPGDQDQARPPEAPQHLHEEPEAQQQGASGRRRLDPPRDHHVREEEGQRPAAGRQGQDQTRLRKGLELQRWQQLQPPPCLPPQPQQRDRQPYRSPP